MYFQEKKTIANITSGLLIFIAYCIFAVLKYQEGKADIGVNLRFWAISILIFIGIGIVLNIIIQIVFLIVNAVINTIKQEEQDDPNVEDEMDKLISLKALKNGYIIAGAGFMISIISLILKLPPALMLNIIFLSFNLAGIMEGFTQLYYYRRGI